MAKYFDAFRYVAKWGTRVLMLRLPAKLLPERTARAYCRKGGGSHEDPLSLRARDGNGILRFCSIDEEGDGEWIEGGGLLGSLVRIRSELAHGDLRALYLAWLRGIQDGDREESDAEPPVPPDLQSLSTALIALTEFLEIDRDLMAVAGEASTAIRSVAPDPADPISPDNSPLCAIATRRSGPSSICFPPEGSDDGGTETLERAKRGHLPGSDPTMDFVSGLMLNQARHVLKNLPSSATRKAGGGVWSPTLTSPLLRPGCSLAQGHRIRRFKVPTHAPTPQP